MNQVAKIETGKARGLTSVMAEKFAMEPAAFVKAIKRTVMKEDADDAQVAAFLMVAHEYDLNPLTKEIYAFPSRGGIQPIVSIDGWMKLINRHDQFDGMEFEDHVDDSGELTAITCRIFRKDRSRATEATEYMAECKRQTEPWQKFSRRMLRHKAAIQCARYAFSFAMMDEDDYERMKDVTPNHEIVADPLADDVETPLIDSQGHEESLEQDLGADMPETVDDSPEASQGETDTNADDVSSQTSADGEGATGDSLVPSPELMKATKAFFDYAKDAEAKATDQNRSEYLGRFDLLVPDRKASIHEREHEQLKAVVMAVDAVIKGEQDYETAVAFFAEQMGFDPETFESNADA